MTQARKSIGFYLFGKVALALFLLIVLALDARCSAASEPLHRPNNASGKSKLVALAATIFPNLTHAEVALLEHADVKNIGRTIYAASGPSLNPDDSSNDPSNASQWGPQREIRASLIRWMSVDPDAIKQIDPQGIRVLGAKIVGSLDLSQVHAPFGITLRNCAIPEAMELGSAEIPSLDLQGSYTGSIHTILLIVLHALYLGQVHLTGIADFSGATMDTLSAPGGHFKYAGEPGYPLDPNRTVLNLTYAKIKGSVILYNGFEADGGVDLRQAIIGGDLNCVSGHFFNPGNIAISAIATEIGGSVILMSAESTGYPFQRGGPLRVKGSLRFRGTRMGSIIVEQAIFSGPATRANDAVPPLLLEMPLITVKTIFFWRDVTLDSGAQFELSGSVGFLADQEGSWPGPGNLFIDGLTYSGFQSGPTSADTRLKWIALQPDYHPQPYRQLAKVLREMGDEKGAVKVLVAEGDARYRQMALPGACSAPS